MSRDYTNTHTHQGSEQGRKDDSKTLQRNAGTRKAVAPSQHKSLSGPVLSQTSPAHAVVAALLSDVQSVAQVIVLHFAFSVSHTQATSHGLPLR